MLLIGDLHIMDRTVVQFREFESFLFKFLEGHTVETIVLLGDVLHFHNKVDIGYMNDALCFIDRLRRICEVVIVAGNHDKINQEAFLEPNTWMNALKYWNRVTIVDTPILKDKVLYCPYVTAGRFAEALQDFNLDEVKLICCHQEFHGCRMSTYLSVNGDVVEAYPLIISGHIHKKQWLGDGKIFYPGTPYPTQHDESGGIIALVDLSSMKIEEISTEVIQKETMWLKVGEVDKDLVSDENIKYVIEGTREQLAAFRKSKIYKKLSLKSIIRFVVVADPSVPDARPRGTFEDHLRAAFARHDEPTQKYLQELKLRLL